MMIKILIAYYFVLAVVYTARVMLKHRRNRPSNLNRRIKPKLSLIRLLEITKSIH
jgi:hypothetical protein